MPTPPSGNHICRPLWLPGSVRATCSAHYWQPIGWSNRSYSAVTPTAVTR